MYDIVKIIENVKTIYESNTHMRVLKDFERVLDELDLYVFENWSEGELILGPKVSRHTVECAFMWPRDKMPNPQAGRRLLDYDCKVSYKKDFLTQPRKIESPDDYRPGTKKGKLDQLPIWIVNIKMPKQLMFDMYKGYMREVDEYTLAALNDTNTQPDIVPEADTDIDTDTGFTDEPTT
jgi:hypothetical protein